MKKKTGDEKFNTLMEAIDREIANKSSNLHKSRTLIQTCKANKDLALEFGNAQEQYLDCVCELSKFTDMKEWIESEMR